MKGRLLALVGGWILTGISHAAPFQAMDPRTMGLGGAAVAAATSASAAFYNPALLASAREEEDFALELPVLAIAANDPDQLREAARDFNRNDYILNYARAIADFNQALEAVQADPLNSAKQQALLDSRDRVVFTGNALLEGLRSLSGKPLIAEANAGIVLGIPSHGLGGSLYFNTWGGGSAVGVMTDSDYNAAKASLETAEQIDPQDPTTWVAALDDPTPDFTSYLSGRFLAVAELGLALATRLESWGGLAVGVTPKLQEVRTYDFNFVARELDQAELQLQDGERVYQDFNLDLGLARPLNERWRAALTLKNVIPRDYETSRGHTLSIEPQLRAGLARVTRWTTLALDLDLTENSPFAFGSPSRRLSVGGEWNVWHTLLLRAGYRTELGDGKDREMITVGLGLSILGVHVEAGAGVGRNAMAAAAQAGFRF